jgi:hypothetical protein
MAAPYFNQHGKCLSRRLATAIAPPWQRQWHYRGAA